MLSVINSAYPATFNITDDLTVSGTAGSSADADLDVKGYSSFGSVPAGSNAVTSGAGSVYIQGNLEFDNSLYPAGGVWKSDGSLGLGTTLPGAKLTVGTNLFQVSSTGDLIKVNNIDYAWPSGAGGVDSVLLNNGAGTLSWDTTKAGSAWLDRGSRVYLTTTTDNVGIGTSFPRGKLEIVGRGTSTDFTLRIADSLGTDRVVVQDQGNVGLGTTVPAERLHIQDGTLKVDRPALLNSVTYTLPAWYARGLSVSGRYLYLSGSQSELIILDIADPMSPRLVASLDAEAGYLMDAKVSGRYVYGAGIDGGLLVYDVSRPASPFLAAEKFTGGQLYTVYVSGKYLYAAADESGLEIYDISVPVSPRLCSRQVFGANTRGIYCAGRYCYLGDASAGLGVMDVSDPYSPFLAGSYDVGDEVPTTVAMRGVHLLGRYAYLASAASGLFVFDVSNPMSVAYAGSFDMWSEIWDVKVAGRYAYAAAINAGLLVLDISSPASPFQAANFVMMGNTHVTVSGKYAYASNNGSLTVIDIGGADVHALTAGTIETGSLTVNENVDIGNNLYVRSGINAGPRGIYTDGGVAAGGEGYFGGNVGIGHSAPQYKLDVTGDIRVSGNIYGTLASAPANGWLDAGANVYLTTPSDKLAIGTQTAAAKLEIKGAGAGSGWALRVANSLGLDKLLVQDDGNVGIATTRPVSLLQVGTSPYPGLAVTADGNTGIATTNPSARLHLRGSPKIVDGNQASGKVLQTTDGSGLGSWQTAAGSAVWNDGGTNVYLTNPLDKLGIGITAMTAKLEIRGAGTGSGFALLVSDSAVTDRLALQDRGNLGLGTTAPAERLHIQDGTLKVDGPVNPVHRGRYDTSGDGYGVYVSGRYAYVADFTSGLRIFDIGDAASPMYVGGYDFPWTAKVHVSGRYAYLADGGQGLRIVDVSNPASPGYLSQYNSQGDSQGVYVSGRYAYLADGDSGLRIIDVSDPLLPRYIGGYDTDGICRGLYVSGRYAYVGEGSDLRIVDITNPSLPEGLGSCETLSGLYGVHVSGRYAYAADGASGLRVIDISNPASPLLVAGCELSANSWGVYVYGRYAYVANGANGLSVVDIADPLSPWHAGGYDTEGVCKQVYVSGRYAYLAAGDSGLFVVDIGGADVHALTAGTIETGSLTVNENVDIGNNLYVRSGINAGPRGIYTDGGVAAGGEGYFGGNVGIGHSAPQYKLDVIGDIRVSGNIYGMLASAPANGWLDAGANVYLTTPSDKLAIGTQTAAAKLEIKGAGAGSGWALRVANSLGLDKLVVQDDGNVGIATTAPVSMLQVGTAPYPGLAVTADGNTGIATTNPSARLHLRGSPKIVDTTQGAGKVFQTTDGTGLGSWQTAAGSAVWNDGGTNVYLTNPLDKLGIGITAMTAKLEIRGAGTGSGFALRVSDSAVTDRLALQDRGNLGLGTTAPAERLHIQDGTLKVDKPVLREVVIYDTTDAMGVQVSGRYAYLADYSAGLRIFDITNVQSPVQTGVYDTTQAWGVQVSGRYAYIADWDSGLRIIDITNSQSPVQVSRYSTTNARKVQVSGRYAYVADELSGLRIIDVSDASSPVQAALYLTTNAYDVYVSGRYAYVSDLGSGLRIIDISSAGSPVQTAIYDTHMARALQVSGRYAYLADGASGLRIMDISSAYSPVHVGMSVTADARRVQVRGKYVYVGDEVSGLHIIDISNAQSPVQVNTYATTGVRDLWVSGRYAYVADQVSGLRIFDLGGADVHALTAGTIETGSLTVNENVDIGNNLYVRSGINAGPRGIYTDGGIAAGGEGYFGGNVGIGHSAPQYKLDVIGDIRVSGNIYGTLASVPANGWLDAGVNVYLTTPSDKLAIGTQSAAARLEIKGAGVGSGWALRVANSLGLDKLVVQDDGNVGIATTRPVSILQVGTSPYPGLAVNADGNTGIGTTNPSARLHLRGSPKIVDTTQGAGKVFQTTDGTGLGSWQTAAGSAVWNDGGTNVYLTNPLDKLGIGITAMTAKLEIRGAGTGSGFALRVSDSAGTDRLALQDRGNLGLGTTAPAERLHIQDGTLKVDKPVNLRELGRYDTGGDANDVYVSGKYAYVGDGASGIYILDVTNPGSPQMLSWYDTTYVEGLKVSGRYLYAADAGAGLKVFDISNPSSPVQVSSKSTPSSCNQVYVSGRYAYTALQDDGLCVLDISDAYSPRVVSTLDPSGGTYDWLYLHGRYAYLAGGASGLSIIDVTAPASPVAVGLYDSGDSVMAVYVSGRYAYVGDQASGLLVIDISNPASPWCTGTIDPGSVYGLQIQGRYAYCAVLGNGIYIVDVSIPSVPVTVAAFDPGGGSKYSVFVSGRYAYFTDDVSGLYIADIGGADVHALTAGTIETGSLTVNENVDIGNNLYVRSGINAGPRGIYTDGGVGAGGEGYFGGNVGIGHSAPQYKLDVIGDIRVSGNIYGTLASAPANGWLDAGVNVYLTTPSDKLAIGTQTAAAKLEIKGAGAGSGWALRVANSLGLDKLVVQDDGNVGIATTRPVSILQVGTSPYPGLAVSADGNTGIATTNPSARLHLRGSPKIVDGTQGNTKVFQTTDGSGLGSWQTAAGSAVWNDGGANVYLTNPLDKLGIGITAMTAKLEIRGAGTGSGFALRVSDSAGTDRLALQDRGNLGLGTTAPAERLHIQDGTLKVDAPINPRGVGRLGMAQLMGVAISGRYAYLAAGNDNFHVVDISQPESPVSLASIDLFWPVSLRVSGRYAYVADWSAGLRVVDISVPVSPFLVGSVSSTAARGIDLSGRYAYIADNDSGLRILDVSLPVSPREVGRCPTTLAYDVCVSGRYAYVTDYHDGVKVVDISNPLSPFSAGSYNTSGNARGIYVSGRYAYVADDTSGLQVFDISNPGSPFRVGGYAAAGAGSRVYVSGRYAYLGAASSGLLVIDISNPSVPLLTGSILMPSAGGVYVSGRYAHVADYESGLRIIDIGGADVHALTAGTIETGSLNVNENVDIGNSLYVRSGINAGPRGIYTDGGVAAGGEGYFGGNVGIGHSAPQYKLDVLGDIRVSGNIYGTLASAPANGWLDAGVNVYLTTPSDKLAIGTQTAAAKLEIKGAGAGSGWALRVANSLGLDKLIVQDNGNVGIATTLPVSILQVGTSPYPGLAVNADGNTGIGTTNPSARLHLRGSPKIVDTTQGAGKVFQTTDGTGLGSWQTAAGSAVWNDGGTNVYLTNPLDKLGIGITAMTAKLEIRGAGTGSGFALLVSDSAVTDRLALQDRGNLGLGTTAPAERLHIQAGTLKVDKPATLKLLSKISTGAEADAVAVSGKYAYVGAWSSGLYIFDISNPSSPAQAGYFALPGFTSYLQVAGRYAYVSGYGWGINIVDVSNPVSAFLAGSVVAGAITDVFLSGRYLYAAQLTASSGLGIYDVSVATAPRRVSCTFLGSPAQGVYVSGRYAYVGAGPGNNSGLSILDVSNPASPSIIHRSGSFDITKLCVSGRYAYLAGNGDGLLILDVSDPSSPRIMSQHASGTAKDVYVAGRYAYLADLAEVKVLDVSNVASPVFVSSYPMTSCWGVKVSGRYLYAADETPSGLHIFDIGGADVHALTAGTIETGSLTVNENVDIGNNLYVRSGINAGPRGIYTDGGVGAGGEGYFGGNVGIGHSAPQYKLDVIGDIRVSGNIYGTLASAPANGWLDAGVNVYLTTPSDKLAIGTQTAAARLEIKGAGVNSGWALRVANSLGLDKLVIFDNGNVGIATTVPVSILQVGTSPYPGLAVTADGNTGIGTTNPSARLHLRGSPKIVDGTQGNTKVFQTTDGSGLGSWQTVAVSGNGGWQDVGTNVSLSQPLDRLAIGITLATAKLEIRGSGTGASTWSLLIAGSSPGTDRLVLQDNGNLGLGTTAPAERLHIQDGTLKVDQPVNPRLVSVTELAGNTYNGLCVSGRYAYVGCASSGLYICDISVPASPAILGWTKPCYVTNVAAAGRYLYATSGGAGFEVFDVSNPASPFRAGTLDLPGSNNYEVRVSGRYAYVAGYDSGLWIVDITDPRSPYVASGCSTGVKQAPAVYVSGRYAYLANRSSGLWIVDVSNPLSPFRAGFNACSDAWGVYVSGRYAYLCTRAGGFRVFDVSNPASPWQVGSCATAGSSFTPVVLGRYAYVSDFASGLSIVDVSVPSSPCMVANVDTGDYATVLSVKGRYVYIIDNSSGLYVIDIGGADVHALTAGTIETGSLYVDDSADIGNHLYVGGGINSGSGGIMSEGGVSAGAESYLGANVGIGTTAPRGTLHVAGSLYVDTMNDIASTTRVDYDTTTKQLGTDIAEFFETDAASVIPVPASAGINSSGIQDGALVALNPAGKAEVAAEHSIVLGPRPFLPAMIIEGSWLKISPAYDDLRRSDKTPVALLGRVPVYCEGEVTPGDPLVSAGGGKVKRWEPGMRIAGYAGAAVEKVAIPGTFASAAEQANFPGMDRVVLLTGHQGLPKVIDAAQDELKELRVRTGRSLTVTEEGNARLDSPPLVGGARGGVNKPQLRLEVDGALALTPADNDVVVSQDRQVVEVGNRSYIRLSTKGRGGSRTAPADRTDIRTVILTKPLSRGQILILEYVTDVIARSEATKQSQSIVLKDDSAQSGGGVTRLSADWPTHSIPAVAIPAVEWGAGGVLVLMADGDDWVEMSRSEN